MSWGFFMDNLLIYIIVLNVLIIILGLISPWRALWWMSKQNRFLVLKYYGGLLILLLGIYLLT